MTVSIIQGTAENLDGLKMIITVLTMLSSNGKKFISKITDNCMPFKEKKSFSIVFIF